MAGAAKPKIKAKTTKREVLEQGIQKAGDSYGRRPWKDDACLGARRFRFAALRSNIIPAALGLANSGSLRSASPLPIGHGAALRVPLLHSSCSRCGLATSAPGVPPSPARPHPTQRAQKLPMRPCRLAGLQPQGEKNCARGLSQRGRACSRQSTLTCPPERTHSQNEKEEEKKSLHRLFVCGRNMQVALVGGCDPSKVWCLGGRGLRPPSLHLLAYVADRPFEGPW